MTLRILIAEDSSLFATVLQDLLRSEGDIEVVGLVDNGEDAIEMCASLRPDLVLMDIQMPRLDGLSATERIMAKTPTPILIVTSDPYVNGVDMTFQALRAGALDLVSKPTSLPLPRAQHRDFIRKIRLLSEIPVIRHVRGRARGSTTSSPPPPAELVVPTPVSRPRRPAGRVGPLIIGVVASTGGPRALAQLMADLPGDLDAAILIVQHITAGFSAHLARWLNAHSALTVREGTHGERVEPGHVYIAPSESHMMLGSGRKLMIHEGDPVEGHCPNGDLLLESIAENHGAASIGAVLSGMGHDGARGLKAMADVGALTMVQDRASSVVYGMPQSALALECVDEVVNLEAMGETLQTWLRQMREGR